jgi:hypothetical protein
VVGYCCSRSYKAGYVFDHGPGFNGAHHHRIECVTTEAVNGVI